ncbi:MAG: MBL fold metallo-hydrolase [Oligoflexales bacterium]
MKVVILGSGTSTGVPVIGCQCEVCTSTLSFNKRTRASIAVTSDSGEVLIVDTTPEFRIQVLTQRILRIDGVLYTHTHADHCHGFDDLRALSFKDKRTIECMLLEEHVADFKARFRYAFEDTGYKGKIPQIKLTTIPNGKFHFCGMEIEPIRLPHGHMTTCGIRIGSFVYATDFKRFPEAAIQRLRNSIHTMVASGVHFGQHETHSVIPETVELMRDLGVTQGYITHLSHSVDHRRDREKLPSNVEFAFDGMVIDVNQKLKYL